MVLIFSQLLINNDQYHDCQLVMTTLESKSMVINEFTDPKTHKKTQKLQISALFLG